jgi:hypothetical protein
MRLKGSMLRKLFVLVLSILLVAMSGAYEKKAKPADNADKGTNNSSDKQRVEF